MASNFFKNKRKPEPKFVPQSSMMKEEIGFLNAFKVNEERYYNNPMDYLFPINTGLYYTWTTTITGMYTTTITMAD